MPDPRDPIRTFWIDVWTEGRVELLPEIFHEGATENGEAIDIAGFQAAITRWRERFPGFAVTIEELLEAGPSRIASRVTYRGTHAGPWAGLPATGKGFEVIGIDLFSVRDGRIAELWHSCDHLELAFQLGGKLVPKE